MIIALEIVAGLVLTSALVSIFTILAAFELGRLVTRDEDQRDAEIQRGPHPAGLACGFAR